MSEPSFRLMSGRHSLVPVAKGVSNTASIGPPEVPTISDLFVPEFRGYEQPKDLMVSGPSISQVAKNWPNPHR